MNINQSLRRLCRSIKLVSTLPTRNFYCLDKSRLHKNHVKLEWVDNGNLGDSLGPVIYKWMLRQKGIDENNKVKKSCHLLTCGSLVGVGRFDAVVWGSGAHIVRNIESLLSMRGFLKYDIRAVRGPLTRQILIDCGYRCPENYGDPAIIMPLIYNDEHMAKKYDVSVILHYYLKNTEHEFGNSSYNYINIGTTDYESCIREILSSKKVISSSLHGIILAETYGVPAIFLNTGGYVDKALIKYYDWYYSTNRWSVKMARSIEEAIEMKPMPLPDLSEMRTKLMNVFPYDLWGGVLYKLNIIVFMRQLSQGGW